MLIEIRTLIAGSVLLVACSSTEGTARIQDQQQEAPTTAPNGGSSEQSTSEATTTQPSTTTTSASPADEWGIVQQESILWSERIGGLEARISGIVWSDQGCLVVGESVLFFSSTDTEPVVSADGRTINVWGETIEIGNPYTFGGGSQSDPGIPATHPCRDKEYLALVDGLVR